MAVHPPITPITETTKKKIGNARPPVAATNAAAEPIKPITDTFKHYKVEIGDIIYRNGNGNISYVYANIVPINMTWYDKG